MSRHRTDRLRQRAATLGGSAPTRAGRLALRLRGKTPTCFDDLARVPMWQLHASEDLTRIALASGILYYRGRIDVEISGARLAPLAAACGEALFDRACTVPAPPPEQCASVDAAIPDAEALLTLGRSLIQRTDDASARALVARATALLEMQP